MKIEQIVIFVIGLIILAIVPLIVPKIREWLSAKIGKENMDKLEKVIENLVRAAEQMYGRGTGTDKMKYVIDELTRRNITDIDLSQIEAMVQKLFGKGENDD